jgi:uncharacterized protein YdbL (DUF1318 family)
MKTNARFAGLVVLAALVLLGLTAGSAYAENKDEVLKRMKERVPTLTYAKAELKIGEVWNGGIEAVKGVDEALTKLLAAENADRLILFGLIAKEQGTTAAAVGELFGTKAKQVAKKGEMFKDKDGQWRAKP